jgi:hypothetical protein
MSVSGHRRQTDDVPPPTPGDPTTGAASSRPGTTAADARPTLITSRHTDASMGAASAMAIRDVLQTGPRVHRRRLRLSSGALIGVALAGSIGAVTAVNATLFPSLGRPTTESVWQNPGKVPSTEAEGTEPTTPRATPVLVVEPTAPPVVSAESARALTTTTVPASSDAPTSSVDVLAVAQPTTAQPTGSGSGSGTVTGTTIATVPASAPVTTSGTKSGSGGSSSSTSGPATTDHSSTSTPSTDPSTDPSTTDATVPTDTSEGAPGDTVDDGDSGGGGNSGKGKGGGD